MIRLILLILLILLIPSIAFGAPDPDGYSGSFVHGETVTITDSNNGFGSKTSAAPLWWDDGEGATLNTPSIMETGELTHVVSTLTGSNKHYNDTDPFTLAEDDAEIQYRATTFRSFGAPHSKSSTIIAGFHDDTDTCPASGSEPGSNVAINISDGSRHASWYLSYYYKLAEDWPSNNASNNYKFFNVETDSPYGVYDSIANYDYVNACSGGYNDLRRNPMCGSDWITVNPTMLDTANCYTDNNGNGYPITTYDTGFTNPYDTWVKVERIITWTESGGVNDETLYIVKHDNVTGVDSSADLDGDCFFQECASCDAIPSTGAVVGGVTIGGFWRRGYCSGTDDLLDDDAARAFDDVYVDTTLSRVIIGNASTYSACTVLEPQPPTAWDSGGGSITVTVNQGALTAGTVYVYVWDSSNNYNTNGYEVTLSESGASTPALTGLKGVGIKKQ